MVVHSQSTGLQRGWFPSVRDLCSCQLILRLGALFVLGSSRNHIIRATRLANFCSDTQDEEGVHEGARRRVVIFFVHSRPATAVQSEPQLAGLSIASGCLWWPAGCRSCGARPLFVPFGLAGRRNPTDRSKGVCAALELWAPLLAIGDAWFLRGFFARGNARRVQMWPRNRYARAVLRLTNRSP